MATVALFFFCIPVWFSCVCEFAGPVCVLGVFCWLRRGRVYRAGPSRAQISDLHIPEPPLMASVCCSPQRTPSCISLGFISAVFAHLSFTALTPFVNFLDSRPCILASILARRCTDQQMFCSERTVKNENEYPPSAIVFHSILITFSIAFFFFLFLAFGCCSLLTVSSFWAVVIDV